MDADILSLYRRLKNTDPLPDDEPAILDWTGLVVRDDAKFLGGGAFGDVFMAKWTDAALQVTDDLPPLAIKVLRATVMGNERMRVKRIKQVWREVHVTQGLQHPNVLRFWGLVDDSEMSQFPCLLTPFMANGTIRKYLAKHPESDRVQLTLGISRGLEYLHSRTPPIVHGDLKADNILIDEGGNPLLTDFGLSRMAEELSLWNTSASGAGGSLRWMAPELVSRESIRVTAEADIWAFGMTVFEITSGTPPYGHLPHEAAVVTCIIQQELPHIKLIADAGFPAWLSSLVLHCWKYKPTRRIPASTVTRAIEFALENPEVNTDGYLTKELAVSCLAKEALDVVVALSLGAEVNKPLTQEDIQSMSFPESENKQVDTNNSFLPHLKRGYSALHVVCSSGRLDIVKLLVQWGAHHDCLPSDKRREALPPIYIAPDIEWTPLQAACFAGQLDAVKLLVGFGADVNIRTQRHGTPLEISRRQGHKEVSAFLTERKALAFVWPYEFDLVIRAWCRGRRWQLGIAALVLLCTAINIVFWWFVGKKKIPRKNIALSVLTGVAMADYIPDIVVYNWKRLQPLVVALLAILTIGLGFGFYFAHWAGSGLVVIPMTGLSVWRFFCRISRILVLFRWYDFVRMVFIFGVVFTYCFLLSRNT